MHAGDIASRARAYESVRPEIVALVAAGTHRVLDVGCANGALGAALKARDPQVQVTGVELDPAYAAAARAAGYDRVIEGDAGAAAAQPDLGRFDCLVAADVLEHLADPWTALRGYAAALEPGGRAIVSLPNVGHWTTYAALARGSWPRKAQGIHDATHLRWFTLRDAIELLEQAGLEVESVQRRPWVLWRGTRLDRRAGPLMRVPVLRTLLCFQHVLAARRGVGSPAS